MNPEIIRAIETRAEWLRWLQSGGAGGIKDWKNAGALRDTYIEPLREGETFFMDRHFCELVDHARRTIPDETLFERSWLIRPAGFLFLANPFPVPHIQDYLVTHDKTMSSEIAATQMSIRAIGWSTVPVGSEVGQYASTQSDAIPEIAGEGWTFFRCFVDNKDYSPGTVFNKWLGPRGFSPWSYFIVRDRDSLLQRIRRFEGNIEKSIQPGGAYHANRMSDQLHEIRWVYTAMNLMSQRLSLRVRHSTDRSTRRRAEKHGEAPPPPFIEVVTLRRLQSPSKGGTKTVEWNYQWDVRGHWRNQWYKKEGVYRPKFIAAYVKGPADKPFKEHGTKLFVARR